MPHLSSCYLVDKARRAYRRVRAKNPALPPLVNGAGKVLANGKLRVVLPTVDGASVVYAAVAVPVWRFHREAPLTRLRARLNGAGDGATATPSERIKRAVDEALVVLADIERRAAVHLEPESQIAAE
jgi:hypothetical protein